jgi:hypothetical protein
MITDETLLSFARVHGHRAEFHPDGGILVYTEWVDGNGASGVDCDQVRNLIELRQLLGYGD